MKRLASYLVVCLICIVLIGTTAYAYNAGETGCINVKSNSYANAVGNGVADDTNALNTIFTYAGYGGHVYFPAGTYLISNTVYAGNLGTIIDMASGAKILYSAAGTTGVSMFYLNNAAMTQVNGLNLDGNNVAYDGLLLDANPEGGMCVNNAFNNITVSNCVHRGMRIATWRPGWDFGGVQDDTVRVYGSTFTNNGTTTAFTGAVSVESAQSLCITFDTCTFTAPATGSDDLAYVEAGRAIEFRNCTWNSNGYTMYAFNLMADSTAGAGVFGGTVNGDTGMRFFEWHSYTPALITYGTIKNVTITSLVGLGCLFNGYQVTPITGSWGSVFVNTGCSFADGLWIYNANTRYVTN